MTLTEEQVRRLGPADPTACVIVLHGGTDDPTKAVRPRRTWLPATMNSHWIQNGVDRTLREEGVATWALAHRLAGWDDDADPTPVREAAETVQQARRMYGEGVRIVLVGISMGGRTAVRVADMDGVVGVVGLVPWLPEEEPTYTLSGKHLRVGYAGLDRTCPLSSMTGFVGRARTDAATVEITEVGPDVHEMVLPRVWQPFTARSVRAILQLGSDTH
ncbi:alpha/beta fold hydrolase [Janibacter sp. Y6]|uniref:alpha/beta fold hydrolase n=1 Tax=Janibacter sp. Y6 TaxID=2913552 RepID=UPI0034A5156A